MALKPPIHGRDHCPGGADPIPCLESYAYIWHPGDPTTPSGSWHDVGSDGPSDEGFTSGDNSASFEVDVNGSSVEIQWNRPGLYLADARALFSDTIADGSRLGVAIDVGVNGTYGTHRIANENTADTVIKDARVAVSALLFSFSPTTLAPGSVRVLVYQNTGADKNVSEVRLHVARISPVVTGTTTLS